MLTFEVALCCRAQIFCVSRVSYNIQVKVFWDVTLSSVVVTTQKTLNCILPAVRTSNLASCNIPYMKLKSDVRFIKNG
jgi:hypothetical protein